MGKDRGGNLRQVHVAAAAQAEKDVRPELSRHLDTGIGRPERRLRLAAGEDLQGEVGPLERFADARHQAGLGQHGVRGDQDALGPEP